MMYDEWEDEQYREYYEEPDYEQFERRMLDLDRDAGEFDFLDEEVEEGEGPEEGEELF